MSGAVIGMKAVMCAIVPSGFSRVANERKKATRIMIESGVIVDCSSSWRGTSAPAHANAHA